MLKLVGPRPHHGHRKLAARSTTRTSSSAKRGCSTDSSTRSMPPTSATGPTQRGSLLPENYVARCFDLMGKLAEINHYLPGEFSRFESQVNNAHHVVRARHGPPSDLLEVLDEFSQLGPQPKPKPARMQLAAQRVVSALSVCVMMLACA